MVAHDSKLSFSYKQPMVRLAIRDARPRLAMMKAKPSEAVVKSSSFWPLLMKAQGIVKAGQSPAMAVVETCFLLRLSKCQLILVLSLKGNTENFKFYLKKSRKFLTAQNHSMQSTLQVRIPEDSFFDGAMICGMSHEFLL